MPRTTTTNHGSGNSNGTRARRAMRREPPTDDGATNGARARRAARVDPGLNGHDDPLTLLGLLWALDHALQVHSKHTARSVGVTGPQRVALRTIHRQPGLSASELAGQLHLDKSTLTGVLHRLEARGLIERRLDPADARRRQLRLSSRGRQLAKRRGGTLEDAVRDVLRSSPSREVGAACRVLARLEARLGRSGRGARADAE